MHDKVNLLPDSKQQRLDEKRVRKLMTTIAVVVSAVAIGVPIVLLTIKGAQAIALNRTQDQINERKTQIQQTPNITTMLTVKDHLDALPGLYNQRTYFSQLIDVLPKVTPKSVRLTDMDIDSSGRITFKGVALTYHEVERFYKAILTYGDDVDPNRIEKDPNASGLFTQVLLEDVTGPAGEEVAFTISSNFDVAMISGASHEDQQ